MSSAWPGAYELVLKGGRVIDPAAGRDGVMDVAVTNGKTAAMATEITCAPGTRCLDVADAIVTPGLIDTHAHISEHVTGDFGLNADLVGVRSGVTALVDQGDASALTFNGYREFFVDKSQCRIFSFI